LNIDVSDFIEVDESEIPALAWTQGAP